MLLPTLGRRLSANFFSTRSSFRLSEWSIALSFSFLCQYVQSLWPNDGYLTEQPKITTKYI